MFYQSFIVYRYRLVGEKICTYQILILNLFLPGVGDDGPLEQPGLFLAPVLLNVTFAVLRLCTHLLIDLIGFLVRD